MPAAAGLLLAAGSGKRFGASQNKVLAELGGVPIVRRSFDALAASRSIRRIYVVCAPGEQETVARILAGAPRLAGFAVGGAERADSVWNGLQVLAPDDEIVAVHDSARPLVSPGLIDRLVADAWLHGAGVPALPVTDTVKLSIDGEETTQTIDRRTLFTVQTPQVFRTDLLRGCMARARESGFTGTDDASYLEWSGTPVHLTPGERENIKITMASDLALAAHFSGAAAIETRCGFGYDAHRLAPGRELWLGGVLLQHPDGLGLEGHSDADVLLHAVADAMLGAAALGDIGEHFPNDDPHYLGASSLELLRRTDQLIGAAGWRVVHLDATLIAERPKIRPHVEEMRRRISSVFASPPSISIKATTNEGLGAVGREEGMVAHAAATLVRSPAP